MSWSKLLEHLVSLNELENWDDLVIQKKKKTLLFLPYLLKIILHVKNK
jgi:hypothetical protein